MTAGNDFDPAQPQPELFSALLTPHRSLNRTGFLVLMGFVSVISFAAGLAFLLMGAWPVLGFFGLDVLAIYWAFRVNFRSARACDDFARLAQRVGWSRSAPLSTRGAFGRAAPAIRPA